MHATRRFGKLARLGLQQSGYSSLPPPAVMSCILSRQEVPMVYERYWMLGFCLFGACREFTFEDSAAGKVRCSCTEYTEY